MMVELELPSELDARSETELEEEELDEEDEEELDELEEEGVAQGKRARLDEEGSSSMQDVSKN